MAFHFFIPPQYASRCTLPEKTTRIHYLFYDNSLNSVKNLNSTIGREILKNLVFSLPPGLPAVRPTSIRSMALEFSHNKGNCIRSD